MSQAQVFALLTWLHEPVPSIGDVRRTIALFRVSLSRFAPPVLPRIWGDDDAARTAAELELGKLLHFERSFVTLDRPAVSYIAKLVPAAVLEVQEFVDCGSQSVSMVLAAWPAVLACERALKGRGRPRRTPGQILAAIERELAKHSGGDDRLLRRLKKIQRWDEWFARLKARGESLLTSTEPPPS